MGARDERIVRLARLPSALSPVPIYTGEPPRPIDCDWLALSCVTDNDRDKTFILYFLDDGGRIRELLQFETLEIALDQVHDICGLAQTACKTCSISMSDDEHFDVTELESVLASAT